ncbi:universal stress protein [Corynebacterium sp. Q4381]|uniref:universal stress protein n=1 Tax=Corynebacterium sp. Marseille-Q4381 TaxID=3121597 RepID=UPI002FE66D13
MVSRAFTTDLAESHANQRPLQIVVGWDAQNTEAIEFAAWLGRSLPVKVQVVSAISAVDGAWKKPLTGKKYKRWFRDRSQEFELQARRVLKAHLPRSQWAKTAAQLAERSDITGCLCETVKDTHADMILLGSRAKTAKSRFRPSSVADELMHSSPVPLGLAPKGVNLSRKGVTRVTYALIEPSKADDIEDTTTFSGLPYAATMACVLGVPLRIVAFSPKPQSISLSEAAAEWNEAVLGQLDRARDQAFAVATELDPAFADTFDVHTTVATGKGWKRATDAVKWKKGDVMCLGSQPSGQLMRVFVGSRESEFIRFAPVPVIIYPRGAE